VLHEYAFSDIGIIIDIKVDKTRIIASANAIAVALKELPQ
jgi:hypothetical protein